MPGLTNLEAAVLSVIWSEGPCTAYAVRRQFQRSLSSHWNPVGSLPESSHLKLAREGRDAGSSRRRRGPGLAGRS
jgi:hypothetical protein